MSTPSKKTKRTSSSSSSEAVDEENKHAKTEEEVSESRKRVINVFNNQAVDHIPVCFWFHYVDEPEFNGGQKIISVSIAGHKKYINEMRPDFIKIMCDGFHHHPALYNEWQPVREINDLKKIKNMDKDNAWITSQVEIAKGIIEEYKKEKPSWYTVFSPVTHLEFIVGGRDNLVKLLNEDPKSVAACLDVIAQDVVLLCRELLTTADVDGIYFSVANPDTARISDETYKLYLEPSDLFVLNTINAIKDFNFLHVCGWEGKRNNLSTFAHYPAKAVGWASTVEGVSLSEGKKLFGGRCIIGGFANTPGALLAAGKKEDIEAEVDRLVADVGRVGVIIGADCSLPLDIDTQRIKWVMDKTYSLKD